MKRITKEERNISEKLWSFSVTAYKFITVHLWSSAYILSPMARRGYTDMLDTASAFKDPIAKYSSQGPEHVDNQFL